MATTLKEIVERFKILYDTKMGKAVGSEELARQNNPFLNCEAFIGEKDFIFVKKNRTFENTNFRVAWGY